MPPQHFLTLDALRGIVALFVVVWHSPQFWSTLPFGYTYLAVDIFFVLSGFVIAHAYGQKLQNKKMSRWQFFKIRAVRLYPMYLVGLILGLIAYSMGAFSLDNWILLALITLFFLPTGFLPGQTLFAFNLPAWSLFYELVVNALYGFFHRFLSQKRLLLLLLVLGASLTFIALSKNKIDFGAIAGYKNIIIAFFRSSFGILLGIFIYHFQYQIKRTPNGLVLIFVTALIGLLIVPRLTALDPLIDLLATFIIIPLGILALSKIQANKTGHLCSFLGKISYPLYAIHYPVTLLFITLFPSTIQEHKNTSGIFLVVFLIVLSNYAVKFVETPLRRHLHNAFLQPSK